MSNVGLFAVGFLVTLLVVASLALLVWGAILDGRDERERRAAADRRTTGAGSARSEPEGAVGAADAA
jgi:hypothetical protein